MVGFRAAEMRGNDRRKGLHGETLAKLPQCKATRDSIVSLLSVPETKAAAFEFVLTVQMIYTDAYVRYKSLQKVNKIG